ncbi:MAG TPA: metal-dependent hydrolase [Candidatus Limnocylindrales bacterium]|nr:metal-dependent hydrolase [Candidatus Limnocylindrales bacterium]
MATLLTHGLVGAVLGRDSQAGPQQRRRLLLAAATCSMLPDIDVIGLRLGVPYGSLWGHRGLTHSLLFAAMVAVVLAFVLAVKASERVRTGLLLFVVTASHGVLDAFTDGGLGVAFFSPFDRTRYFFPWTPISVSPIGLTRIFSGYGVQVFWTELIWVWLPVLLVAFVMARYRRATPATPESVTAKARSAAAGQ